MKKGARAVSTNQADIYDKLEAVVRKYARSCYLRPLADHTRTAFAQAREFVENFYRERGLPEGACREVILDSGCGTGESTWNIARLHPGTAVIGIDKSALRLSKAGHPHIAPDGGADAGAYKGSGTRSTDEGANKCADAGMGTPAGTGSTNGSAGPCGGLPRNAFWVRAELLDFWRLALEETRSGRWHIPYHALFYPNPWPKQSEATRRFHLHPIFPTLLSLGDVIELRTNWEIYAREFAEAARILDAIAPGSRMTTGAEIRSEAFEPERPVTAFERKYKEARQQLWRVRVNLV